MTKLFLTVFAFFICSLVCAQEPINKNEPKDAVLNAKMAINPNVEYRASDKKVSVQTAENEEPKLQLMGKSTKGRRNENKLPKPELKKISVDSLSDLKEN